MQASKIKIYAVATFLTIAVLFCTSFYIKEERKWAFEVCELNGIEQGGLIYPGQIIAIKITR